MAVSVHNQKMRLEQLKRFKGSILDQTSSMPRDPEKSRFKFKKEYIFLTVCASDDITEAENLLSEGVDINTSNVDGLTALHQACLNQRMDVVRFLVEHSADVNIRDNDGWTPLHAACSTDNIEIAGFLINNGSQLDAVSFDGELPVDVTEDEAMVHFLSDIMAKFGVDSESARSQEEKKMMEDAVNWLNTKTYDKKIVHLLSGASPLHIAAARGYVGVIEVLLKAGADINAQDYEGWTPMHAAAHWGHKEACRMLVDNLCNLGIPNSSGLLAQDVADPELGNLIEELKKKQVKMVSDQNLRRRTLTSRRSRSSVSRMSFDQKQMMVQKSRGEERATMEMMFEKRSSRTNLGEGNVSVFDEEKEEEMMEGEEQRATGDEETVQSSMSMEGESENSMDSSEKLESELPENESILSDVDTGEEDGFIPDVDSTGDEKKLKAKIVEDEDIATESSDESLQQKSEIGENNTAEDGARSIIVAAETKSSEVSQDASFESVAPATGSFLSSATSAALQALARSHRWSMDDPKKDEEKENARRSRVMQLRKEKLEKRRSTQGVSKDDISRAEASLHAVEEEELPEVHASSCADNEEVTKRESGNERPLVRTAKDVSKDDLQTKHLSSISNKNEDITLTLYRRSVPQEKTIPFEEDDITAKAAALARARRKGRLSSRPVRQENFEETVLEKENQDKATTALNETKSVERRQAASERVDRLSGLDNVSANSSSPISALHLPSSASDDAREHSCPDSDSIDYKKLYEKEHSLNESLALQNKALQQQLNDATSQLDQLKEVNRNIAKEKEDLEKKISKLETEYQNAEELMSSNQRLKMDNAALVRVIGHLSKQTNP